MLAASSFQKLYDAKHINLEFFSVLKAFGFFRSLIINAFMMLIFLCDKNKKNLLRWLVVVPLSPHIMQMTIALFLLSIQRRQITLLKIYKNT